MRRHGVLALPVAGGAQIANRGAIEEHDGFFAHRVIGRAGDPHIHTIQRSSRLTDHYARSGAATDAIENIDAVMRPDTFPSAIPSWQSRICLISSNLRPSDSIRTVSSAALTFFSMVALARAPALNFSSAVKICCP